MLTDFWNDVTAFGSLVLFLALIVGAYAVGQPVLAVALLIALILCYATAFPIKIFFFKRRPNKQKYTTLLEKFDAASFPSVHSMRAVSLAIVLCAFANNLLFTALAAALVVGVLYSRIHLQKHFKVDVFWGTIIGAVIGYVVAFTPLGTAFGILSF